MSNFPYRYNTPIPKYFWLNGYLDYKYKNYDARNRFLSWSFALCFHEKSKRSYAGETFELEPFEFIFSIRDAADSCGLTKKQFERILQDLKKKGILIESEKKRRHQYSVYKWSTDHFSEMRETLKQEKETQRETEKETPKEEKVIDMKELSQLVNEAFPEIEKKSEKIKKETQKETQKETSYKRNNENNFSNTSLKRNESPSTYDTIKKSPDSLLIHKEYLKKYCKENDLKVTEHDIMCWLKKFGFECVKANINRILPRKSKLRNIASSIQDALEKDYAGISKLEAENRTYAEDVKNKGWASLEINKQYCVDLDTGNDYQYDLPDFKDILNRKSNQRKEAAR